MKHAIQRWGIALLGLAVPALVMAQSYGYDYNYNYDDYNYDTYDYNYSADDEAALAALGALGIGFTIFAFIAGLIGFVLFVFTIWMIIDCARRDFDQKTMWILLMVFLGFIPALIYYFMIKRKNVHGSTKKPAAPAAQA